MFEKPLGRCAQTVPDTVSSIQVALAISAAWACWHHNGIAFCLSVVYPWHTLWRPENWFFLVTEKAFIHTVILQVYGRDTILPYKALRPHFRTRGNVVGSSRTFV